MQKFLQEALRVMVRQQEEVVVLPWRMCLFVAEKKKAELVDRSVL